MFMSGLVITLYFLPFFIKVDFIKAGLIPEWGVIISAGTLIYSAVLYLWPPRKILDYAAVSIYASMLLLSATLMHTTGGAGSPFISLWFILSVFSLLFGAYGAITLLVATTSYLALLFFSTPELQLKSLLLFGGVTLSALVASFIIFHKKTRNETIDDEHFDSLERSTDIRHASSNTRADIVIQAIDDGVLALDQKGNIQLINPAAQRILGWGNQDALSLNYLDVLKLSDAQNKKTTATNDPVALAISTNKSAESDVLYATTGGGKRILLSITVSPVGKQGEGVIAVFRDITRKHAEEREQAEFISTASHEMRTPVASIEGYLGLALNPATAQIDDKARDFITKAHESARHLGRLFQDLLDVSKADDGRLSNHPKVVDVADYLGGIIEGLQPHAKEKGLRLFYKPSVAANDASSLRSISPVYYANVDNDHLREATTNLTENAIKYTPTGDIVVDVTGTAEFVTISVQDSGIGIAKEDLSHLFQKFYRIDNSATREIGGTGLGLYLCRRLAEVMGGRIWVESEVGKGSTFHLEIPRIDHTEAMRMMEAEAVEVTDNAPAPVETTAPLETAPISEPPVTPVMQPAPVHSQPPMTEPQPVYATPVASQPIPVAPQPVAAPQQPQPYTAPAPQPTMPLPSGEPTLSSIEQNPSTYLAARPHTPVSIPARDAQPGPQPRS